MTTAEKLKIDVLLKGRENLKNALMYRRSYNEIKKILEMEEWNQEKYKNLLTPNIWQRSASEIKAILTLPEWNKDFSHLLAPNIWSCSYEKIKTILNLKELTDKKFKNIITSNI